MRVLYERTTEFEPHETIGTPRVRTPGQSFVARGTVQSLVTLRGGCILELGAPMHAKLCGPLHEGTIERTTEFEPHETTWCTKGTHPWSRFCCAGTMQS